MIHDKLNVIQLLFRPILVSRGSRRWIPAVVAPAVVFLLAGCLPDDHIRNLVYSPCGQKLAYVSDNRGLSVVFLNQRSARAIVPNHVCDPALSWNVSGDRIGYTANPSGSWNIYITDLDGRTTQVTEARTRQSDPIFLPNGDLLFLTTVKGRTELFAHHFRSRSKERLAALASQIVQPVLSPDGRRAAFAGFEALRPQIYLYDLASRRTEKVTSETQIIGLVPRSISWGRNSDRIVFMRERLAGGGTASASAAERPAASAAASWANSVCMITLGTQNEKLLIQESVPITQPFLGAHDRYIYFLRDGNLIRRNLLTGLSNQLSFSNFRISLPASNPAAGDIAFVVQSQLLAATDAGLANPRFLAFDFQDKFILAEEYYQKGRARKTYDIYKELAASVRRTEDPLMAHFLYIANLARVGQTKEAVRMLESMLRQRRIPSMLPEAELWKVLGYSHMFMMNDDSRARECLERHEELMKKAGRGSQISPAALHTLDVLRAGDDRLARMYARAVKARLDADFPATAQYFGELLDVHPGNQAVREEYLRALDGYEREVFFFSPSQRPFNPTPAQRAAYFEHYLKAVPAGGELADQAKVELFQIHIQDGNFAQARALLDETLKLPDDESEIEGMAGIFQDYLDRPEAEPWLESSIRQVFLHESIRPRLEAKLASPYARTMMRLAAAKLAVVSGSPEQGRREADGAIAAWQQIPEDQRHAREHYAYARLLVLRGHEAELRGLYAEALTMYDQALAYMRANQPGEFEFFFEARFRAEMIRALTADKSDLLRRIIEIGRSGGDELVNPAWNPERLVPAINEYGRLYDSERAARSPWRQLMAYQAAILLDNLRRFDHARAGLLEAVDENAPMFLREKAMLELAYADERDSDPWGAARWYEQIASLPACGAYEKQWLSYKLAEQHLRIGYKTAEAHEALQGLQQKLPVNSPLAVQVKTLLETM